MHRGHWRRWPVLVLALVSVALAPKVSLGESRTIDGSQNNISQPQLGAAGSRLVRLTTIGYEDLVSDPAGSTRPGAREISNQVCTQQGLVPNLHGITDFLWQWGQFVDHDLDLTGSASPIEPFHISVPTGDPFFDPDSTGVQVIPLARSLFDPATGTAPGNPREQVNEITAFIDGSNVYGSDALRAAGLRTLDGTGLLRTSGFDSEEGDDEPREFLPFNTEGFPNAGGPSPSLYLAGDVRANEQVALTALHTLFVREHNRLARQILEQEPSLTGEEVYQRTRAIVGAELQVITYQEFLPLLLGPEALSTYEGYQSDVNPGVSNAFATAAYRLGHSMLSPTLLRLKKNGRPIPKGHLALRDAFFAPDQLSPPEGHGITPLLRGLSFQNMQDVDVLVIDDVRNFLFGLPGQGGFDLASLNIQRGRDHGLPSYNQMRADFGLAPRGSFAEITSNVDFQARLKSVYAGVNDVDVWAGGLAEDHVPGALVGELFFAVLRDQFERLRDGDRFWYQLVFSGSELAELEATTLAEIIRRNSSIGHEMQDNVFMDPCLAVGPPSEAGNLRLSSEPDTATTILSWDAPELSGGTLYDLGYDAIRSVAPADFVTGAACIESDKLGTTALEAESPPLSGAFFYLIRAKNICPDGEGTVGTTSLGAPRAARTCS